MPSKFECCCSLQCSAIGNHKYTLVRFVDAPLNGSGTIAQCLRRALQMVDCFFLCLRVGAAHNVSRILSGDVPTVTTDGWWGAELVLEVGCGTAACLVLGLVARGSGALTLAHYSAGGTS